VNVLRLGEGDDLLDDEAPARKCDVLGDEAPRVDLTNDALGVLRPVRDEGALVRGQPRARGDEEEEADQSVFQRVT